MGIGESRGYLVLHCTTAAIPLGKPEKKKGEKTDGWMGG